MPFKCMFDHFFYCANLDLVEDSYVSGIGAWLAQRKKKSFRVLRKLITIAGSSWTTLSQVTLWLETSLETRWENSPKQSSLLILCPFCIVISWIFWTTLKVLNVNSSIESLKTYPNSTSTTLVCITRTVQTIFNSLLCKNLRFWTWWLEVWRGQRHLWVCNHRKLWGTILSSSGGFTITIIIKEPFVIGLSSSNISGGMRTMCWKDGKLDKIYEIFGSLF